MKTIRISETEYLQMQQRIDNLQQQLKLLQNQFKLHFTAKKPTEPAQTVSIKRGSAKAVITYIAEDFTAPLDDFHDYTIN